jgi:hypothetical protein
MANQDLWWILGGILLAWIAISTVRGWIARAKLDGMKEVADAMIRGVSYHYERPDVPLAADVAKAVDDMNARVARCKNDRERAEAYKIGAGVLADKMGEAAFIRGSDAGRFWQEPREGDYRIDLPMQSWMTLRSLAHRGFLHWMPHYTQMLEFHCRTKEEAEAAASVVEALELKIPKDVRGDPEYSMSLSRNMLVWDWDKRSAGAEQRPEPMP